MHIPAEDDRAEPEAVGGDGQKLLFRHELATEHAINVDAGHFDFGVILEELGERLDSNLGVGLGIRHVECLGEMMLTHGRDL